MRVYLNPTANVLLTGEIGEVRCRKGGYAYRAVFGPHGWRLYRATERGQDATEQVYHWNNVPESLERLAKDAAPLFKSLVPVPQA